MSERVKGLSKKFILSQITRYVILDQKDPYGQESEAYNDKMNKYTFLASASGATEYELSEAYFLGTNKDDRQSLLDVYCEKFWHDKDFSSFEQLQSWTEMMIKLRDNFHLQDPLEESAEDSTTPIKTLHISDAFKDQSDKQGLFDLYSLRIIKDESFPTLEELEKWTNEMVKIKTEYHLEDPYAQQAKNDEKRELIKSQPRFRIN